MKVLLVALISLITILTTNATANATGKNSKENKLTIYLKATDYSSHYNELLFIQGLATKIQIEIVLSEDEEDYLNELLGSYDIGTNLCKTRLITEEEEILYGYPWSVYILEVNGICYFGNYKLLNYLSTNLDQILNSKENQARIVASGNGLATVFSPFAYNGKEFMVYDDNLKRIYKTSGNKMDVINAKDYFFIDSTINIFKVTEQGKPYFYELMNDKRYNGLFYFGHIGFDGANPFLVGDITFQLTELKEQNRKHFLVYFNDYPVSRRDFTYIQNSGEYYFWPEGDIVLEKSNDNGTKFYSFIWQKKKNLDSFYVAEYNLNEEEKTWYRGQMYLLDKPRDDFGYNQNVQFLSADYATHCNIPILYKYKEEEKIGLAPLTSHIFQTLQKENELFAEHVNIGNIWNDEKTVKFYLATNESINVVTYYPAYSLYKISEVKGLPSMKKLRNLSFSPEGIPVVLFQGFRSLDVWIAE